VPKSKRFTPLTRGRQNRRFGGERTENVRVPGNVDASDAGIDLVSQPLAHPPRRKRLDVDGMGQMLYNFLQK
jgi:hypothetical protein